MVKLAAAVKKFVAGEEGASLVEYSLLVALLAAASIAILYGLGQNVKSTYTQVNNAVGTANIGITTRRDESSDGPLCCWEGLGLPSSPSSGLVVRLRPPRGAR